MAETNFDFQKFIADSKQTFLSPGEYFKSMSPKGGYIEPIIKVVIYGIIAGIFSFFWGILKMSAASSMSGIAGMGSGIASLFISPVAAVIGLFIGGVICLLISMLCSGKTDFETVVRAVSATMIMMPINAFFGFTYGINFYLGSIVALLLSIYGLWILYNMLVFGLSGKELSAKIVVGVLGLITIAFSIGGMFAVRGVNKFAKNLQGQHNKMDREKAKKAIMDSLKKFKKEK